MHEGDSFAGKILVVPCSRGSLAGPFISATVTETVLDPIGYVFTKMDSKCGTTVFI